MSISPLPFDPDCARLVYRRNLPHWRQDGAAYFVTFRLADSVPLNIVYKWLDESRRWLDRRPLPHSRDVKWERAARIGRNLLKYLDRGHGQCVLANLQARAPLQKAMLHFDGVRYLLGDYVIMPNHVHALVLPLGRYELGKIVASWKAHSAVRINRVCSRSGKLFQGEPFDHIVRHRTAFQRFAKYIRDNPQHLPEDHATVGCGELTWD